MQLKGIKRGKNIELLKELDIPDGQEIAIEIPDNQLNSEDEKLKRLEQVFGKWKDDPELDEIFAEIDRERHSYFGRKIDSFDD